MKIAINDRENSFSKDWIEYCEENNIPFKLVDCYSNDIFEQMEDCDVLMWHWSHTDHAAALFARQLTYSLEQMGNKVFPDSNTCRFFDDKIGQKYLFEAMNIPHVPTYIFYDKQKALDWIETTEFPKVFKLSKGAGSANVRLVKSKNEAKKLVKQAFGKGFKPVSSYFSDAARKIKRKKRKGGLLKTILNAPKNILRIMRKNSLMNHEKGYVYFQDFIEGNDSDIRIVVVGDKVFSLLRRVLPNDFRASGSGERDYDPELIDLRCVDIARNISKNMKFQSMAYDFIFKENVPLLVEVSYSNDIGKNERGIREYLGFWDTDNKWNKVKTEAAKEIIKNI